MPLIVCSLRIWAHGSSGRNEIAVERKKAAWKTLFLCLLICFKYPYFPWKDSAQKTLQTLLHKRKKKKSISHSKNQHQKRYKNERWGSSIRHYQVGQPKIQGKFYFINGTFHLLWDHIFGTHFLLKMHSNFSNIDSPKQHTNFYTMCPYVRRYANKTFINAKDLAWWVTLNLLELLSFLFSKKSW